MAENIDFDEIDTHNDFVEETKQGFDQEPQPLTSVVKKPQTAYAIFLQENKEQLKEELHKIDNFKPTMYLAEASKRWNALDPQLKQKYLDKAQKQKETFNNLQQVNEEEDEDGVQGEELNQMRRKFMQLPMNRVRQICQLDQEDYTLVSKQALVLITKATELFVQDLAGVCGQIAKQQKRKTMNLNDIISAASNIDKFHFIKESRLPALNPRKQEEINTNREIQKIIEEDMRIDTSSNLQQMSSGTHRQPRSGDSGEQ